MKHASTGITDLDALADELLAGASAAHSGRATHVFHAKDGGLLSQIFLGLTAGKGLSEHENPGEAMLTVLRGRVVLTSGEQSWELAEHQHVVVPQARHHLVASEDSVVVLTVARTGSH